MTEIIDTIISFVSSPEFKGLYYVMGISRHLHHFYKVLKEKKD